MIGLAVVAVTSGQTLTDGNAHFNLNFTAFIGGLNKVKYYYEEVDSPLTAGRFALVALPPFTILANDVYPNGTSTTQQCTTQTVTGTTGVANQTVCSDTRRVDWFVDAAVTVTGKGEQFSLLGADGAYADWKYDGSLDAGCADCGGGRTAGGSAATGSTIGGADIRSAPSALSERPPPPVDTTTGTGPVVVVEPPGPCLACGVTTADVRNPTVTDPLGGQESLTVPGGGAVTNIRVTSDGTVTETYRGTIDPKTTTQRITRETTSPSWSSSDVRTQGHAALGWVISEVPTLPFLQWNNPLGFNEIIMVHPDLLILIGVFIGLTLMWLVFVVPKAVKFLKK